MRSVPGLGRSRREENGYPLQYCCLENSMDRGAWWVQSMGGNKLGMTERLTLSLAHASHTSAGSHMESAAAAAAKSLQSCPTLCDPIDGSPPGSPVPGILQARTLECSSLGPSQ